MYPLSFTNRLTLPSCIVSVVCTDCTADRWIDDRGWVKMIFVNGRLWISISICAKKSSFYSPLFRLIITSIPRKEEEEERSNRWKSSIREQKLTTIKLNFRTMNASFSLFLSSRENRKLSKPDKTFILALKGGSTEQQLPKDAEK